MDPPKSWDSSGVQRYLASLLQPHPRFVQASPYAQGVGLDFSRTAHYDSR